MVRSASRPMRVELSAHESVNTIYKKLQISVTQILDALCVETV